MARDCYDDCIAFLDSQLDRLLNTLKTQGLLDNTVVVITADHGESFGVHRIFGHGGSLYLDEVAVPLVVLAPGAPANRVVDEPVSLRDLPATIVDLAGLKAGSPFRGTSLAAGWPSSFASGSRDPEYTAAFSELAHPTVFEPQTGSGRRGLQMSLVAIGKHYVRDGMGTERLFDLARDPLESTDLMASPDARPLARDFRQRLLKLLTDNPGAAEVENAYLKNVREQLRSLIDGQPFPAETPKDAKPN